MTDRRVAEALDACDGLAGVRQAFVIPDDHTVYLDGNSLGRLPRSTVRRLAVVVEEEWGRGLVGSWQDWIDWPLAIGDRLAPLLGARSGEVALADSTTVNLHKLAGAALAARPDRPVVVTEAGNFPTDRYVLEGLCQAGGRALRYAEPGDGLDGQVAVAVHSAVDYRTGSLVDVAAVTDRAHRAGALVLWDLSHAAGAVPLDLTGAGADLAAGCTYKYLCGGPGAPAFVYVRRELQQQLEPAIRGWFGQREQFAMGPTWAPAGGIRAWLAGTPPVLGLAAADEGVRLVAGAGVPALRAKSVALTDLILTLADEWLAPMGVEIATPRQPARRGGHVSLATPEAWPLCQALAQRYATVTDFRPPDLIRLGPVALYTRFVDVWDGMDRLRRALGSGAWRDFPVTPGRIT